MLKMMIVDDERGIRDKIEQLDWEKIGIEVECVCDNGLVAYNQLHYNSVDIIITDIRMPIMNGIELAKAVNEEFPGVMVIILSGYDEFEYARKCLEYKVFGYLLKPIEINNLFKIVSEAAEDIKKRNAEKQSMLELERKAIIMGEAMYEKVMRQLLFDTFKEDNFEEQCRMAGITLPEEYNILFLKCDENTASDKERHKLIGMGLKRIAAQFCTENMIGYSFLNKADNSIYIISTQNKTDTELYNVGCEIKDNIYADMAGILRTTISCGISGRYGSGETNSAAREAGKLLESSSVDDAVVLDTKPKENKNLIMQTVLEFIHSNYSRQITLKDAADAACINHIYLSTLFKKNMGINFIDYLTEYRISQAKELIEGTMLRMNKIAKMVGYESPQYFGKVFKNYTGMSPYEYKQCGGGKDNEEK